MNNALKSSARCLARLAVLPAYGAYRLMSLCCSDRNTFSGFSQVFSQIPGRSGVYLRREFYRLTMKHCSASCHISFGTIFSTSDIEIHDNVYIGAYCVIGRVRIGKNTLLASRVSVVSGAHQHGITDIETPIREQEGTFAEVFIGEDCWIGEAAVVAADVAEHSVVAAGAVVFDKVEPYSIVKGNPAELVRDRRS